MASALPSAGAESANGPRPVAPRSSTESAAPEPAKPIVPTVKLGDFQQRYAKPVTQLELGDPPTALALGGEPLLFDGKAWQALPLPDKLAAKPGERDEAFVYFGRDNRPRMMGARLTAAGGQLIYLRYKGGAWRKEPREIGHLASRPPGPLYGLLGHADPEVVCKPTIMCIIKRRSGWTMFTPGGERPKRVVLSEGRGWAIHDRRVERLDDDGWKPVGHPAPFTHAWGVVSAQPTLWVSDPPAHALYRHDGAQWQRIQSPIEGPRGMWAAGPADIWLAGDGGAAHFDGETWRRVEGLEGPLVTVIGRGAGEVWLAGAAGVWRTRDGIGQSAKISEDALR